MRWCIALGVLLDVAGCVTTEPPCPPDPPATFTDVAAGRWRSHPEAENNPCRLLASSANAARPAAQSCASLELLVDDVAREVRITYDWEGRRYVEVYRITGSRNVPR